jgi:hypothetical protein
VVAGSTVTLAAFWTAIARGPQPVGAEPPPAPTVRTVAPAPRSRRPGAGAALPTPAVPGTRRVDPSAQAPSAPSVPAPRARLRTRGS